MRRVFERRRSTATKAEPTGEIQTSSYACYAADRVGCQSHDRTSNGPRWSVDTCELCRRGRRLAGSSVTESDLSLRAPCTNTPPIGSRSDTTEEIVLSGQNRLIGAAMASAHAEK